MTRHVWTHEPYEYRVGAVWNVYRLREEGRRVHSVSLWLDGVEWSWIIYHRDGSSSHGCTPTPRSANEVALSLEDAQREAVAHARRVGAMSERDEVEG